MSDLQFTVGHAPGNLGQCPCPECAGRRMDDRIQRCETAIERLAEIFKRMDRTSQEGELVRQYIRRDF